MKAKKQVVVGIELIGATKLMKLIILPLYLFVWVQQVRCWLFKQLRFWIPRKIRCRLFNHEPVNLVITCALAGEMPPDGFLAVDQAEDLKFKAVKEAVETYKKQTNKQWARIVGDNAVLRKTIILQKQKIMDLIATRKKLLEPKPN